MDNTKPSDLIDEWIEAEGFTTWAQDHAAVVRNLKKWMDRHVSGRGAEERAERSPCEWCANSSYHVHGSNIMHEPCLSCTDDTTNWPKFSFSPKVAGAASDANGEKAIKLTVKARAEKYYEEHKGEAGNNNYPDGLIDGMDMVLAALSRPAPVQPVPSNKEASEASKKKPCRECESWDTSTAKCARNDVLATTSLDSALAECHDYSYFEPVQSVPSEEVAGDEEAGEANVAHSYARVRAVHSDNYANVGDAEWDAFVLADEIDRLRAQLAERTKALQELMSATTMLIGARQCERAPAMWEKVKAAYIAAESVMTRACHALDGSN